jgi:hypothetical protein
MRLRADHLIGLGEVSESTRSWWLRAYGLKEKLRDEKLEYSKACMKDRRTKRRVDVRSGVAVKR